MATTAALSASFRTKIIGALRNVADVTKFVPYLSLHTGDPSTTGANEVTNGTCPGYVRKAVTLGGDVAGLSKNTTAVVGPTASGDWVQTSWYGLWDAETSGNFVGKCQLDTAKTVLSGDHYEFAIDAIQVTIN